MDEKIEDGVRGDGTTVDKLLSAFDRVSNSNSLLLRAPKAEGDLPHRFQQFVSGPDFRRKMLAADLTRDWLNYHDMDEEGHWVPLPGDFYRGTSITFQHSLTSEDFVKKLCGRLNEGPSFYDRRIAPGEVQEIVEQFVEAQSPERDQVLEVKPDFLFCHDVLEEESPELPETALRYFDGWDCDLCFCWLSEGELRVLLLSGSP